MGGKGIHEWRIWKLRRVAISSNADEIQSILKGEDHALMWAQLNGCCGFNQSVDILEVADCMVATIPGLLATDSKGAFDAVELNEGPLLKLSNIRAALQAYQSRQQMQKVGTKLLWLDWNLADCMTKKNKIARQSMIQFLNTWIWQLKFDPNFIVSAKKNAKSGNSAMDHMRKGSGKAN